jgi:hypothetical protein
MRVTLAAGDHAGGLAILLLPETRGRPAHEFESGLTLLYLGQARAESAAGGA